jgi:hypothetical protein
VHNTDGRPHGGYPLKKAEQRPGDRFVRLGADNVEQEKIELALAARAAVHNGEGAEAVNELDQVEISWRRPGDVQEKIEDFRISNQKWCRKRGTHFAGHQLQKFVRELLGDLVRERSPDRRLERGELWKSDSA